jgi:hypothetical protein
LFVLTLFQLPPVCNHNRDEPEKTCLKCHVTAATCWQYVTKYELTHSERHSEDLPFSNFLAQVRRKRPTQQEIDDVLSGCSMMEDQVIELADEDTKVLCSHREQVSTYNAQLVRKFFPGMPDDAVRITPVVTSGETACSLDDLPHAVRTWASSTSQHALQRAAPSLRVMLTQPLPGVAAAAYGAMAHIVELHQGGDSACGIESVTVCLDADQSLHRLSRTTLLSMKLSSTQYQLSTFPLRPCVVVSTPLNTDAGARPELQGWLAENSNNFQPLTEVAVGAHAMLNKNISLPKGVSNGAPCVVRDIELNADSSVKAIVVQLESTGRMQRVTRSATRNHCHDGHQ